MGYFRRHKIRNHTAEEVSGLCDEARDSVVEAAQKSAPNEEIEERMTNWACWRELLARLQGDNKGREK